MLALLKDGAFISEVAEGNAFNLPDGRHVSTSYAGWYSIQPMPIYQSDGEEPAPEGEAAAALVTIDPTEMRDGYELVAITEADPVPSGQRIVSTSVEMVAGSPKFVHVLEAMTEEEIWAPMRIERNVRLAACDWTQLADCPLSTEQKAVWASYRQALRDLPDTSTDPDNIVWPSEPI